MIEREAGTGMGDIMGQRVTMFDDLDEDVTDDIERIEYSYKGQAYAIELGLENRVKFDEFLEPFIEKSQKLQQAGPTSTIARPRPTVTAAAAPAPRAPGGKAAAKAERTLRIRVWGRENGFEVKDGGRIKKEIVDAYEAEHPDDVLGAEPEATEPASVPPADDIILDAADVDDPDEDQDDVA